MPYTILDTRTAAGNKTDLSSALWEHLLEWNAEVEMQGCLERREWAHLCALDMGRQWCWRRLESPLDCKEIQPVHPKGDQCWVFIGRTDAEAEAPILWPPDAKSWLTGNAWERLRTREGDNRGWDGWMASLTQWAWVWASAGRWWRTGKPGVLQSMGSQRVGHDWATEQQDSEDYLLWLSYITYSLPKLLVRLSVSDGEENVDL